jgi:hypothetical protein
MKKSPLFGESSSPVALQVPPQRWGLKIVNISAQPELVDVLSPFAKRLRPFLSLSAILALVTTFATLAGASSNEVLSEAKSDANKFKQAAESPTAAEAAKAASADKALLHPEKTPEKPAETHPEVRQVANSSDELKNCDATVDEVVRAPNRARLQHFCEHANRLPVCISSEGRPIQHADSGNAELRGKKILVLGMIHGDEPLSGEMALEWEERLQKIDHRNQWRVVPMLNPDGLKLKTRMNANGVDLNRNFPTKDWKEEATSFWKKNSKSDPRRFPGAESASEAETKCVIAQIKDFKPDFIVSIHTPYHVLDFDGPHINFPHYADLPWRALGNFPGSLGRYMWRDYQVPVLTIELGTSMVDAAKLQDIIGTFAIEAVRHSGQKTASTFEML